MKKLNHDIVAADTYLSKDYVHRRICTYTSLPDEISTIPKESGVSEQVLSWLGYAALFAFCGWAFIELGIGADHLIEVVSNWII